MPELLRFSSSARLLEHISEEMQAAHRPTAGGGSCSTASTLVPKPAANSHSDSEHLDADDLPEDDARHLGDDALTALGF